MTLREDAFYFCCNFSIGLKVKGGGWEGWEEPDNKEIGSKYALRWNGLLVYFVYMCVHGIRW